MIVILHCISDELQSNERAIISNGLQRSNGKSFGTGFQISYSDLHSSFIVAVQTSLKICEAVYPLSFINDISSWNTYSFSWSKNKNKLFLYIDGKEVYTNACVDGTKTDVASHYYINIGRSYDHLFSYVSGFGLRDLKLWGNFFKSEEQTTIFQRKGKNIFRCTLIVEFVFLGKNIS